MAPHVYTGGWHAGRRSLLRPDGAGGFTFANTKAIQTDGVNESVRAALGTTLSKERTDAFSFGVTVKPDNWGGQIVMGKWDSVNSRGYILYCTGSGTANRHYYVYLRSTGGTSEIVVRTTNDQTNATWHDVAVTYDGSSTAAGVKIYIDGAAVATTTVTDNLTTTIAHSEPFSLGNGGAGFYFPGKFTKAWVWGEALDATEVAATLSAGEPADLRNHAAYSTLNSWWLCGDADDSITTIKDRKGSVDLTPTNMEAGDIVAYP